MVLVPGYLGICSLCQGSGDSKNLSSVHESKWLLEFALRMCVFPEIVRSSAEQRRINPTTSTRYLITLSREDAIPLPFTPLFLLWGWKRDVSRPHLVWTGEVSPPMVPLLGDLHPPSGGSRPMIVMRMGSFYVHDCVCFTTPVCSFSVLPPPLLLLISGGYGLRASSLSSR